MKLAFLSGVPVRSDIEAAPVGVFDIIREDLRQISTIQPVDRAYIERSDIGYRGILFSHDRPHMFALNGNGFTSKPLKDEPAVLGYCFRLEEEEQAMSARVDGDAAAANQEEFNERFAQGSPDEPSPTATPEDGPAETLMVVTPIEPEPIERTLDGYVSTLSAGKDIDKAKPCGGAIVVNKEGKMLLVKPRNGYGDYDWTFPKGYPTEDEETTAATARREAREETGYHVFAKRFIGRFTHNDGGTCDYYECDLDGSKEKGAHDEFETEAVKWVSLTEALELLNDDVDIKIVSTANNLIPQLVIKGGHTGTMIALKIPPKVAKKFAIPGGEPVKSMHVTVAYLGKKLSEGQKKAALTLVRQMAADMSKMKITLGGVGRFSASATSEGKDVVYLSVDSPELTRWRPDFIRQLEDRIAVLIPNDHGFIPHVTLAYVDKKKKTPITRIEPVELSIDAISFVTGGKWLNIPLKKVSLAQRLMIKALPKGNGEESKVGVKPPGASKKQAGATGKTRYTYPQEGGKPGQPQQQATAPGGSDGGGMQAQQPKELPHPDLPPPEPEQNPIAAEHPEKKPEDARTQDPTQPTAPKHTLNVAELCSALQVSRQTLMDIVKRLPKREDFVRFMKTHLKKFSDEHGLEGDYFGLLFDVLTGKVPEGQPGNAQQAQQSAVAKPAKTAL